MDEEKNVQEPNITNDDVLGSKMVEQARERLMFLQDSGSTLPTSHSGSALLEKTPEPHAMKELDSLTVNLGPRFEEIKVEPDSHDASDLPPSQAKLEQLSQKAADLLTEELRVPGNTIEKLHKSISGEQTTNKQPTFLPGLHEISTYHHLYIVVQNLTNESMNNKFINLASALIHLMPKVSKRLKETFDKLVEAEGNADLKGYVNYLTHAQSISFQVTAIDNPRMPKVLKPTRFSLLRLAHAKAQLARIFVILLQRLCGRRTYNNGFQVPLRVVGGGGNEAQEPILYKDVAFNLTPRKLTAVQRMELSESAREEFLTSHAVQRGLDERIWSEAAEAMRFDVSHCPAENTHVFSPLKGFTIPFDGNGLPFLYSSAARGCIKVNEGKMLVHDVIQNTTKTEKGEALTSLNRYLYSSVNQDPDATLLWIHDVGIKFFLNNSCLKDGAIKVKVAYRNWEIDKLPEECTTLYEDKIDTIERKSIFKNFCTSRMRDKLISDEALFLKAVATSLANQQSFLIEPLVIVQGLQKHDDWSLYLSWDAFEAPAIVIGMLAIARYLSMMAERAEIAELKKVLDQGDQTGAQVSAALGIQQTIPTTKW